MTRTIICTNGLIDNVQNQHFMKVRHLQNASCAIALYVAHGLDCFQAIFVTLDYRTFNWKMCPFKPVVSFRPTLLHAN